MKKIIQKIIDNKVLFIIVISVLAFFARVLFFKSISSDMSLYLIPWTDFIKNNGYFSALKYQFSDYNFPYLYILTFLTLTKIDIVIAIKIVSVIFDYLLALVGYKIIKEISKSEILPILAYVCLLFTPTILINSSRWGQCDSIYATFALLSVLFYIKGNYHKSFLMLGISFAFKLQAIFLLPAFLILWAFGDYKKVKWYYFLEILIPEIILCIPAILIGRPINEIFTVYFNQSVEYNTQLTGNFFNLYTLLDTSGEYLVPNFSVSIMNYSGVIILFIIYVFTFIYGLISSRKKEYYFTKYNIIFIFATSVFLATYLLPRMKDRYNYVGEVLLILFLFSNIKYIVYALGAQLSATITYAHLIENTNIYLYKAAAIFNTILVLSLIYKVVKNMSYERKSYDNNRKLFTKDKKLAYKE